MSPSVGFAQNQGKSCASSVSLYNVARASLALPVLAMLVAAPLGAKADANVLITIDKTTQYMTVWVDGIEQYTWPVSTGRPGYATPRPCRMVVCA
jgi:lipoprotein-anchoring transpeptidase ErfK/SrfK